MNKNAILKNLNDLSSNPMFMLSMTSRELFHSNFWAWILKQYPKVFTQVFYEEYDGKSDIKIHREKFNIDLLIEVGEKFIIIENKLKSIPCKDQLNKYWAKVKTDNKKLILVSYFKPLFRMEENWEYLSYEDLCKRLQKYLSETAPSYIDKDDEVFITSYVKFLKLLNQFQNNIELNSNDTMGKLWGIIKDKEIQDKLNEINFEKTFQRAFMTKLTFKALEKFHHKGDLLLNIDCGRDLKVYSDMLLRFQDAWSKNLEERLDLNFLGVSVWGTDYRYYAGLNKKQCGVLDKKNGKKDAENKQNGYDYLMKEYPWFFDQEENKEGNWGGYSYDHEMYLYKKVDASGKSVKEITQQIYEDLNEIYFMVLDDKILN